MNNQLRSTTSAILEICPQFRILVVGKSGVGKSSLINQVFGVTEAQVSEVRPGNADINYGISSKHNPQFLLHDSKGFEYGEYENYSVVQRFIKGRNQEPEIKDKLHAVWLCIQAPGPGDRLETGVEEFLTLKKNGEFGRVPIIVVLTKYDNLVSGAKRTWMKTGKKSSEINSKDLEREVNTNLRQLRLSFFQSDEERAIPYTWVSTRPQYQNTCSELIRLTTEHVEGYIADAAIVTGMSQKINPEVKIRASIEVGKREHWGWLASDTGLPEMGMKDFLDVIHRDIVKIWNMEDPDDLLLSQEFKHLMLKVVNTPPKPQQNRSERISVRRAILGIIDALMGPIGPLVVIAKEAINWVVEQYSISNENLERAMVYIISLTIVMQNIFWIQSILAKPQQGGDKPASARVSIPIKRRFIKLAHHLYIIAGDRGDLLSQINAYAKKADFANPSVRGATIDRIIDLINSSTIVNKEAFEQRNAAGALDRSWENNDEAWD